MCIRCIVECYVGEQKIDIVTISNIRGCIWIIFEHKEAALYFAKKICKINLEKLVIIKELPSRLSDLSLEIHEEERWCGHRDIE